MLSQEFLASITDEALADRLRSIAEQPGTWAPTERKTYLLEAARRLERNGPPTVDS